MKKLLALILSAILLLSACAFAEGGELTINNIVVNAVEGEQVMTLDFSGIDLKLAAATGESGSGLRVTVAGGGADIASLIASQVGDNLLLTATGISDVYALSLAGAAEATEAAGEISFGEEDLAAITALVQTAMAAFAGSITDLGTEEIEGVVYQNYAIEISAESVDAVLMQLAALLDSHPEITDAIASETGASSFAELVSELPVDISVSGTATISDVDLYADVNIIATETESGEAETLNASVYGVNVSDEASGVASTDLSCVLSIVEEDESEELANLGATINTTLATGEFYGMDGYLLTPVGDDYDGLLFGAYSPLMVGDGLWQLSLLSYDQTNGVDLVFGQVEGMDCLQLSAVTEEGNLIFYYEGAEGSGQISLAFEADGTGVEVYANVATAAVDDAWTNVDGSAAVDVLTISDAQTQKLSAEAMALVMNLLSGLASANETVAALVGSMMG